MADDLNIAAPIAEPPWLRGLPSPYFKDSHRRFQAACRKFLDENLHRHALDWETAGQVPPHVFDAFAAANFLIPAMPAPLPVEWLRRVGITKLPGDVSVEEFDSLHGYIFADEVRLPL